MERIEKGLSGGQGDGFGRRSGPLSIRSVSLQALEGCGEKDTVVVRHSQAPVGHALGDGVELWGFCGIWLVRLMTCQSSSVMFMMGYFG